MFSWTMLISGNKLAEQIYSAVFGNADGDKPAEVKVLRDTNDTSTAEVKTLDS